MYAQTKRKENKSQMAKQKRNDIEDLTPLIEEVSDLVDDLIARYSFDETLQSELKFLKHHTEAISIKIPRLCNLRDFKGYKFAIIDEKTGEPRHATKDEALRLIMDYKPGNVIDIYKNWTVVNGQWVRRPEFNPDGSKVER